MGIKHFKDIPDDWQEKRLMDICQINPPRVREIEIDGAKRPLKDDDQVTFIAMEDVTEDARINNRQNRKYVEVSKGFTPYLEKDVLVAKITPCFENGKGALVTDLVNKIGFGSTEFHVIRNIDGISDSQFLYYITNSYEFRARGQANMQGSAGQRRVPTNFIKAYHLRTPPIIEQTKISKILSTWDKSIELVETLIKNSQQQKKALMQQLLTDKKPHPSFTNEWTKIEFSDIASLSKKKYNPKKDDISHSCIELEHLSQGTGQCLGNTDSKQQLSIKSIFKKGDVLFGKLRPYLKKYWLADIDGVCSTEIWVLQANIKTCLPDYLFHLIQSHKFIQACNVSSGSRMPRADWAYVSEMPFELPSIEEQKYISKILNNMDKTLLNLYIQHKQLNEQKKSLMQKLFNGERRVKLS